jgi:hypothetical protein
VVAEEDTLKFASSNRNVIVLILAALLSTIAAAAADQSTLAGAKTTSTAAKPALAPLPKVWHSTATNHDFRVELKQDLFVADWANVPPTAAKRGEAIHTECRRAGEKWVGSSHIHMLFEIPGSPAKETKLCTINVRFEVDSISPEKISGHSEALHAFDVNSCQIQQTSWGSFTWVPKK